MRVLQQLEMKPSTVIGLEDGPLRVAQSCDMIPSVREHKDSNEFLNILLNRLFEQLPRDGKHELQCLFQLTTLELNKCLIQECSSLSGKTNRMWNMLIQIPTTIHCIRLQSLLWTRMYGRLSTEDDEICNKCDLKPAVHHGELALSIPYTMILTINRTSFNNRSKINSPIICDKLINLRGIEAKSFDDEDIDYKLKAAVLHKGPSRSFGHFVACVFHTEDKVVVYDDDVVQVINEKSLLTSIDFMESVYMCFYVREDRKQTL